MQGMLGDGQPAREVGSEKVVVMCNHDGKDEILDQMLDLLKPFSQGRRQGVVCILDHTYHPICHPTGQVGGVLCTSTLDHDILYLLCNQRISGLDQPKA